MTTPYISMIVPVRNDDHGGEMIARMSTSLNATATLAERYGLDIEYLVVEYNPPPDRPGIAEVIPWPAAGRHVSIRIVQVPSEVCRRHPVFGARTFSYALATNTGIRRARGRFVLPSTIDHVMPPELVSALAARNLDVMGVYRTDRCDVDRRILGIADVDEQIAFARDHVLERFVRPAAPLDRNLPALHTDACGDFLLMARPLWHRLRGFREDELLGMHIDSILLYAAFGVGLREEMLDGTVIYHIDHDDTFVDRVRRGDRHPETGLTLEEMFPIYGRIMVDLGLRRRSYDFNGPDWGLGGAELEETWVHRAGGSEAAAPVSP